MEPCEYPGRVYAKSMLMLYVCMHNTTRRVRTEEQQSQTRERKVSSSNNRLVRLGTKT